MQTVARLIVTVERWCAVSAQLALAFMMVSISYDAIMRYAFAAPTRWSFEVNGFLMIYIAMIPAASILRTGDHLNVEFISNLMKGWLRTVQRIVVWTLGLAFSLLMLKYTFIGAHEAWAYNERMSTTLGTPMVLPKAILPFGFTLLSLQFGLNLLGEFMRLPAGTVTGAPTDPLDEPKPAI